MFWIPMPLWSVRSWLGGVLGVLALMLGRLAGHLRRARRLAMPLCALSLALAVAVPSGAADVCIDVSLTSVPAPTLIFADGFESASISKWEDPDPVSSFPATGILDLLFDLSMVGELVGDAVVELAVYTPNGHLYQRLSAPVSSLAAKAWTSIRVEGYRDPLPVHSLTADPSTDLQLRLPVAGTPIIANSLYGTWTARVLIDGEPADCADPLAFEMTQ
jgi:hypothetical protein